MDLANSALDKDAAAGAGNSSNVCTYRKKKYLSLEARHSKAIETARIIRSKLIGSIFIPKQPLKYLKSVEKPLAIPLSKSKYQVTNVIKKCDQDFPKEPQSATSNDTRKQFSLKPNRTDKQEGGNKQLPKVLTPFKKWKHKQYRKYLLERRHVIRTTMHLPLEQRHQSQQDKTERTIEDELKSMGLEVSSDTENFENVIGENNESANEAIQRLGLQQALIPDREEQQAFIPDKEQQQALIPDKEQQEQAPIPAKEQANENTNLKSREQRKSIEREINTNSLAKEAKSMEREINTNSLAKESNSIEVEEIHSNSLVNRKQQQTKASIRDSHLVQTKSNEIKEVKEIFQNYNDSLHAVNDFNGLLQPLAMDDAAIHKNLMELHSSINEFSAFLYRTYRSLELMEALPSCTNQPSEVPLPSTEFVIRIDVPDMMEQTITLDSNEIMQHTIDNYERNKLVCPPQELLQMEKSIEYKSPNKQIKSAAMRKDIEAPVTAVANRCREKTFISKKNLRKHRGSTLTSQSKPLRKQIEPTIGANISKVITQSEPAHPGNNSTYPIHTNRKPSNVIEFFEMQNEAANSHRYEHNLPQGSNAERMSDLYKEPQSHPAFRNFIFHNNNRNNVTQHGVMPPQPNSISLPSASINLQYPPNAAHPQISASNWENILRQPVLHAPSPQPFQIPFPFATQLTPITESREYLSTYPSTNVNPLLTPPQSMDCQALPMFRPPSYYPPYPKSYTQSTFIPMTPPSEDTIRYEAAYHHHPPPSMPPMMFPPAIGRYPQAL